MKKTLLWILGILLSPILLFLVLMALLYVPPIQNWVVHKVAAIASEQTGMAISVEHVDLVFPLDLGVDGVRVLSEQGDTIADIQRAVVDVELCPLFHKQVVVNELAIEKAQVNTLDMISDLQVSGRLGYFRISSDGIDLDKETVMLNGARLEDADVLVQLSDTAAVDTTKSEMKWVINADSIGLYRSRVEVHMPGDTMRVAAYLGQARAFEGVVDLGRERYTVGRLLVGDGKVDYLTTLPDGTATGLVALSTVQLQVDSILYQSPLLALNVRDAGFRADSLSFGDWQAGQGFVLSHFSTPIRMDEKQLDLPALRLNTPDSDIEGELSMDLNAFDDALPGKLRVRLNASVGKQDLTKLGGNALPKDLMCQYPNHPLIVKGSVNGNLQRMEITGLDMKLPTALHVTANGYARNLTDMDRLLADLNVKMETQNLNFVMGMLPRDIRRNYRIPAGTTMGGRVKVDGQQYLANITARQGRGVVRLKGSANLLTERYDANLSISQLNVHNFMPHDSIFDVTADAKIHGQGFDPFDQRTRLNADVQLYQLHYASYCLDGMSAKATLANGHALATLEGTNDLFDGTIHADALLGKNLVSANLTTDIRQADIYRLGFAEYPLTVGMCGNLNLRSDLDQSHAADGLLGDFYIKDEKRTYLPETVGFSLKTNPDTTWARMQSGDLKLKFDASGGYERLLSVSSVLTDTIMAQFHRRHIDQQVIKGLLPYARLYVSSGRENPIANYLRSSNNIDFMDLLVDMSTSPEKGLNGKTHIYSLNADSTRIDTISLNLKDNGQRLTFQGVVENNRRNPQFVFRALFDGHLSETGGLLGLRYFDSDGKMGLRLGTEAIMEAAGMRFHLLPARPLIGYKEFALNQDNYILLDDSLRITADVSLLADDGVGIKLYSENPTSDMKQDLTVSLNRFDLDQLTSVMPYMPRITGILDGDFHVMMDKQDQISLVSDMAIATMTYEGCPLGDINTDLAYLQKEDGTHVVEGRLFRNKAEVGFLKGGYHVANADYPDGYLDGSLKLTKFPMEIVNGFIPDQLLGFEGFAESELAVRGTLTRPHVNGVVYFDQGYLLSQPYGVRLRFNDKPVTIDDSKLLLDKYVLHATNGNPFTIDGNIDFGNTDKILTNLTMSARNFQLIDQKRTSKSIAYGKAFVNFFSRLTGSLDRLHMRGRLDVLGSTDLTYLLLDSPLSTDNQLEGLVKFTDFNDTTQMVVDRPAPSGMDMTLDMNIDQGAHFVCGLNADLSNYVDVMGGGSLRMGYTNDGMTLNGRLTLNDGKMKYSLPVIPLKTFTIHDGSYVEFTGDMMNPRLNITATERTKASVASSGSQRTVAFDCGVIITKTLNDMGLEFIIDAPEDNSLSTELSAMTPEQRGKLAVTMLTTGMYLDDGNTSNFTMNDALSSFLQSEINSIAGTALKTLDLSFGLDNVTEASGQKRTDYSFKFAKRFWNNRLKVQIGGKVSESNAGAPVGQQSIFDNVLMEYRLSPTANEYVSLFYNQNVYDWLEGYTGEYGVGFAWRRKMQNFKDILTPWKSDADLMRPMNARRDSTARSSAARERQEPPTAQSQQPTAK